jgi:hypothetical protein
MVSHTIPGVMTAGQSQVVSITVKNTGTTAWTSATGYRLGTVGDLNGDAHIFVGTNRINLPADVTVASGQSHTFTFTMTAPGTAGIYHPQFRMIGGVWFGETLSTLVQVF